MLKMPRGYKVCALFKLGSVKLMIFLSLSNDDEFVSFYTSVYHASASGFTRDGLEYNV